MKGRAAGFVFAGLAATGVLCCGPAAAQSQPGFDCNLYGPTHPCDPYLLYPPGQSLSLTIRAHEAASSSRSEGRINTLRQLFASLHACWQPPAAEDAFPGMQLTIRLSFKRDGSLLGAPRFTYINRLASEAQRDTYRLSVVEGLMRCTPLPFTAGLGGAVAGRPLVIRYIENRNTRTTGL